MTAVLFTIKYLINSSLGYLFYLNLKKYIMVFQN